MNLELINQSLIAEYQTTCCSAIYLQIGTKYRKKLQKATRSISQLYLNMFDIDGQVSFRCTANRQYTTADARNWYNKACTIVCKSQDKSTVKLQVDFFTFSDILSTSILFITMNNQNYRIDLFYLIIIVLSIYSCRCWCWCKRRCTALHFIGKLRLNQRLHNLQRK